MSKPNHPRGDAEQDHRSGVAPQAHRSDVAPQGRLLRTTEQSRSVSTTLPEQIFITGTDTGIGKTVISAILTIGLRAHYWKPIQSGTIDGTDTEWIQSVSKLSREHFLPEIYSLRAPLSPHAAAQLDGVEIELERVNLPQVTPLIVEGAGGIMVPLNKHQYMLDLIERLTLPTIVVARSGLGTINHTLLTLSKLRTQGVEILGVVMNGPINPSNREALEHFGQINILAEIPPLDSVSHESLRELYEQEFEKYFKQSHDRGSTRTSFATDSAAAQASCEVVSV